MSFLVVDFTDRDEVSAVPHSWIIGDDECFWPPYKTSMRLEKAIKNQKIPGLHWEKFQCRILKSGISKLNVSLILYFL